MRDVLPLAGNVLVTAYALERPDGQWSIMLINKDHDSDRAVSVSFADSGQNPLAILPERWTASPLVRMNTGGMGMRVDRATPIRTARRQNQRYRAVQVCDIPCRKASVVVLRGRIAE